MRVTNLIFAFVLLFFLASCGGGEETKPEPQLIGTWEAQTYTANAETKAEIGGYTIAALVDAESKQMDYTLSFTEEGYTIEGDYELTLDINTDGQEFTHNQLFTNNQGEGDYNLNKDELTLTNSLYELDLDGLNLASPEGGVANLRVEKLTETELILVQDVTGTTVLPYGGVSLNAVTTIHARSVWKRL